jgi:hypothetical protein
MPVSCHSSRNLEKMWRFSVEYGIDDSGPGDNIDMRILSIIYTALCAVFEPRRVIRWARVCATVVATTAAVLLASFVAVAMGLI